jgi:signal peptidase II
VRRLVVFVIVAFVTLALDQSSKAWARGALHEGTREAVIDGYWDWELARNPGVAFSLLPRGETGTRVALSAIAALAVGALVFGAARTRPDERRKRVAYALIAGGALGNLVDRVRDGAVTDFVRWHVHDHLWPIFNIADAALVIGVVVLIAGDLFARRRERAKIAA